MSLSSNRLKACFVWFLVGMLFLEHVASAQEVEALQSPAEISHLNKDDELRVVPANSWGGMFGSSDELFSIGGQDIRVRSDESTRNAVIIAGSIQVEGEIEGDLIVIAGTAEIDGRVGGDVVVVGGAATFGPRSEVRGDTVLIGGPFKTEQGAQLRGQRREWRLSWLLPAFGKLKTWLGSTLLLARPFAPNLSWTWWLVGGLFVVNFMILLLLPRVASRSVQALSHSPVTSFLIGLCVLLLFGPLMVLLVASGFGILLVPFLLCLALATLLVGKVAVYTAAGGRVVSQMGVRRELPIPAFILGSAGFLVAYLIPVIGFMAVGLVIPLGVGAVILAGCYAFKGEVGSDLNDDPPGVRVSETIRHSSSFGASVSDVEPSLGSDAASESPDMDADDVYRRVGFWPRLGATLLDIVLVGLLFGLIVRDGGPGTTRLLFFVWFVYHVVMLALRGATFGGIVLGLRCVTLEGQSLSWGTAAIRSFGSVFSFAALLIGFFWASWSRERQSWHDIVAGTTIIKASSPAWLKRRASSPSVTPTPDFSSDDTKTVS